MNLGDRLRRCLLIVTADLALAAFPVFAQDTSPETPAKPEPESGQAAQPPDQNRGEISESIAENTQTALSLKHLLLGQNWHFFGRVEGEAATYSGTIFDGEDGAEIRRLRVGLAGVLSDRLSYKGEFDLADKTMSLSDLYLKLDTSSVGTLTIGNQRVAQNLSAMSGSLSQLFMEFPLPVTTFSLSRRLGVSQDYFGERGGVHAMAFSRDPNNDAGKHGFSIRGFFNPAREHDGVAHLGFSAVREKMDRDGRYSTRPESHVTEVSLVDTGPYSDLLYQNIFGLEVAGATGSMSGRIEAFKSTWERAGGRKNEFYGGYVEVGYFLTRQTFNYRQGRFFRPDLEGSHAWEIGGRISWVDLDDRDIRGGEQVNLGLAVNYYASQSLRFQTNLLRLRTKGVSDHDRSWLLQARVQFNW
jgi:phosphate-selective porin OprO/OprP